MIVETMTNAEKIAISLIKETAAIEQAHMAGDHVTRSMLVKRRNSRWPSAFRKQKSAATKAIRDIVNATRRGDEAAAATIFDNATRLIAGQFAPYTQN